MTGRQGPLAAIRVLELGGIGPGPFCGMMLADLGSDVIRVDRPGSTSNPVVGRNRRSLAIDLKNPRGAAAVRALVGTCDAVLEGVPCGRGRTPRPRTRGPPSRRTRTGLRAHDRLGPGRSPGPAARPRHQLHRDRRALHAIGGPGDPVPPLNLVGDFGGGGMLLALGLTCALLHAKISGTGQVVDAAMTDGTAALLAMTYGFLGNGTWQDRRRANRLDGGAPYYRVYRCADDRHVAVGCIEPQFFAAFLDILGLAGDPEFTGQHDVSRWPAMHHRLEEIFAARTRDEWAGLFAGTDACTTPVLSLTEAPQHPHNAERGTYRTANGVTQPVPAPRFHATPAAEPRPAPQAGQHTREVLAEAGLSGHDIQALVESGTAAQA